MRRPAPRKTSAPPGPSPSHPLALSGARWAKLLSCWRGRGRKERRMNGESDERQGGGEAFGPLGIRARLWRSVPSVC